MDLWGLASACLHGHKGRRAGAQQRGTAAPRRGSRSGVRCSSQGVRSGQACTGAAGWIPAAASRPARGGPRRQCGPPASAPGGAACRWLPLAQQLQLGSHAVQPRLERRQPRLQPLGSLCPARQARAPTAVSKVWPRILQGCRRRPGLWGAGCAAAPGQLPQGGRKSTVPCAAAGPNAAWHTRLQPAARLENKHDPPIQPATNQPVRGATHRSLEAANSVKDQ